ncbi:putative D-beta-hydroxybutyrate dehydrogenase, mitochondrial-like [Penaeus vannamei]|uniref:Putative D-beta-hydroxybutyrate dehydrogenase, mitochondrial-like n=1 Tax=Penaeus vannamei TaxID=6689 RepID=A0A3R7P5V4_PENVA|nr:putative D-beta-hydroxybutyrate dehydrogenase, mitochondrial-like [Penaeus vannamei]
MALTLDTAADLLLWGCAGSVLASASVVLGGKEDPGCFLHLLLAVWVLAAAGCLARTCLKVPVYRKAVLLDVTKQEQLQDARKQVQALMQKGEVLWGLVNNAGIGCLGLTEWPTIAKYKQTADVNIFGMVAATQTFLPLIKQSKGRIVNVGSMVGRVPQPIFTAYVVTKYAVEGFSDCLRVELKPWQVKISVIEPGNFAKEISLQPRHSRRGAPSPAGDELWGDMHEDLRRAHPRQELQAPDSMTPVLEAMTEALTQRFPRARYMPMDLHTFVRIFVATHLPEWLYDLLYRTNEASRKWAGIPPTPEIKKNLFYDKMKLNDSKARGSRPRTDPVLAGWFILFLKPFRSNDES